MKISIKTLGCRANRYESDKVREKFALRAEFVEPNEPADVCIVNTCTVTSNADSKSRQAINALRNLSPDAKVLVFGCGPRVDRKLYEEILGVDLIAFDRPEIEEYLDELLSDNQCFKSPISSRTRAVIKIQDGCRNFCTYCIICHARGEEVSYPVSKIMSEIKEKEALGIKEIVLTGIHVGSYNDSGLSLADLILKILNETNIPRVRLSSIEPQNFSEKFFSLLTHPRFCKHLHMSLQSGSDSILKRMNRRYDTTLYAEVCKEMREICPELAITTDVICGFPGETLSEHKESLAFAGQVGFAKIHVFPFSKRPGTPANLMPDQVPFEVKKERASEFKKLASDLRQDFISRQLGKKCDVLFEETLDGRTFMGWTDNYIKVEIAGKYLTNEIVQVKLSELLKNGNVKAQDSS